MCVRERLCTSWYEYLQNGVSVCVFVCSSVILTDSVKNEYSVYRTGNDWKMEIAAFEWDNYTGLKGSCAFERDNYTGLKGLCSATITSVFQ